MIYLAIMLACLVFVLGLLMFAKEDPQDDDKARNNGNE